MMNLLANNVLSCASSSPAVSEASLGLSLSTRAKLKSELIGRGI